MDKNQATGLILISLLMIVWITWFSPEQPAIPDNSAQAAQLDSVTQALQPKLQERLPDSVLQQQFGSLAASMKGTAQTEVLESEELRVVFTTQGGQIEQVELKNYTDYWGKPLLLFTKESGEIAEDLNLNGRVITLDDLFFTVSKKGEKTISFSTADGSITRNYTLSNTGFEITSAIDARNLPGGAPTELSFAWAADLRRLEKDVVISRQRSTVNYYTTDENFDYLSETSESLEEEQVEEPIRWVSMKQKFFNMGIIADGEAFTKLNVASSVDKLDSSIVKSTRMAMAIPMLNGVSAPTRYYFGPNQYDICKLVTEDYEKNVYLGWGPLALINRYAIMPLFHLLEKVSSNYGIVILLLVIIIKMFLLPLTYKSYVSMGRMRVLKPQIDEIKERIGDDQMAVQQETMKLYQKVGVNPISGCIPMLMQSPIFIALFQFFPNLFALRQQPFLWADDLSSWDSVASLPFNIPFFGDHISLFTMLFVLSQLAYTYYNNQMGMAGNQPGPLKYIGYVMPIFFLGFFNSYASGLTYYYLLSNLITIGQQLGIRQMVDDEKILAKLERQRLEREKNPKKKGGGGFMARLQDMQRQQEEMLKQREQQKNGAAPIKKKKVNKKPKPVDRLGNKRKKGPNSEM